MKKIVLLFSSALLLLGCAKEVETPSEVTTRKTYTITADLDNPVTRSLTNFDETSQKFKFTWEQNEVIGVVPEGYTSVLQFKADDPQNGLFSYDNPDDPNNYDDGFTMAVSPREALVNITEGGNYTIKYLGTYLQGKSNAIMVAGATPKRNDGPQHFSFKHVGALVKVSYANVPAGTYAMVFSTPDHSITGEFTFGSETEVVEAVAGDAPTQASEARVVLMNVPTEVQPSMDFYLPIPTGKYQTFNVKLVKMVGEEEKPIDGSEKTFSTASPFTVSRADVVRCPVVTLEQDKYYVKVTDNDDIVPGDYLIVHETLSTDWEDEAEILSGVVGNIGTLAVSPIITDGELKKIAQTGNEAYNIVVEEGTNGYTMKLGNSYLKYSGSGNNLYLAESVTDEGTEWNLTVEGISNVFYGTRYLQFNSSDPRFACYTGTQANVSLYFLEGSESAGKQPVTMSFNPTSVELTYGESFTAPALTTNPAGLSVTYSSSNPNVASVDENSGEVTIVADGSATITASFPGNGEYKSGSAFYTITVNPAPMALPFTESFTNSTGTMGWNGNAAQGTISYDNEGWDVDNAYGAGGSAKFGKASSGLGKATTPEIHYSGNATLTFKAGAWSGSSESTNLKLSVSSGTIYSDASLTTSVSSVTMAKGAWTEYTLYLKDLENPFTVTFEGNSASNSRFFLDDINIVEGIEQPAPTFGASISNTDNVSAAGGTKVVNVSGNVSWTAAATNGATVSPASGTGIGSVTVTIPANTSVENTVSYVVTVSTTAEVSPNSYEFTITQDAASGVVNTSTEDNPYTPAEAYALAGQLGDGETLPDVYVAGIISHTDEYNSDYHNVSFNISVDGLTSGSQFTLFRVPASSANDFQVGDAVEFKGTLKNYEGDTPELTADFTKIYQYKAPTISPDGGTFSASQNVTITADEGVTIRYTLDGTNPTASTGTVYESTISISETTIIKAIGTKNGAVTGIVSATFTKNNGGGVLTVNFENATDTYSDWVFNNMTTRQTNDNVPAHGGSYFGTTGGKESATLTTATAIANPSSITFYISKASKNNTASSWRVRVSSDGTTWTNVGNNQSASSGITLGTWYEVTRDLSSYSNVYIQIQYDGTTAVRTIDDVSLTFN